MRFLALESGPTSRSHPISHTGLPHLQPRVPSPQAGGGQELPPCYLPPARESLGETSQEPGWCPFTRNAKLYLSQAVRKGLPLIQIP